MIDLPQKVLIEVSKAIREAYVKGFEEGKKKGKVRIVSDSILTYMAIVIVFSLIVFLLNV